MQKVLDDTNKNNLGQELDEIYDAEDEPELANHVSTSAFIANTIEKLQSQSRLDRNQSKMTAHMRHNSLENLDSKKSRNLNRDATKLTVKQRVMNDVSDLLSHQRKIGKSPSRAVMAGGRTPKYSSLSRKASSVFAPTPIATAGR